MITAMAPVTNPQNTKGSTIRGILFPKNSLMVHSRPKERAPASIKNRSTPILRLFPVNWENNHLMDAMRYAFYDVKAFHPVKPQKVRKSAGDYYNHYHGIFAEDLGGF